MRKEILDNIFVDTNIIVGAFVGLEKDKKCLDYLFSPAINRRRLFLSSLSIAQFVAVFQRKGIDDNEIRKYVKFLLSKFNILSFTENDINESIEFKYGDMEDAMQFVIGKKVRCFYYVTNNTKDYNKIKNIKVINSKKVRNID